MGVGCYQFFCVILMNDPEREKASESEVLPLIDVTE